MAQADPHIAATIAVSMFSPAVTADTPRNLLVIAGQWEGMLKAEALRAVGLSIDSAPPVAGTTYGDFAAGTARRAAFSPWAEHISVLYKQASMAEALAWLDATFGVTRTAAAVPGCPRPLDRLAAGGHRRPGPPAIHAAAGGGHAARRGRAALAATGRRAAAAHHRHAAAAARAADAFPAGAGGRLSGRAFRRLRRADRLRPDLVPRALGRRRHVAALCCWRRPRR